MVILKKCPVCSTSSFEKLFDCEDFSVSHETFSISACTHCGLKATNPRPDDALLSKYYETKNYISHSGAATNIVDKIYLIARRLTLKQKLKLINRYQIPPGKLLDYGCGTGEFINTCKTGGWKVNGVEPAKTARIKSEELNGIKIFDSVDQVTDCYDIITMWHVLEHIPDLEHTLSTLSRSLSTKGTMFIAVPNYQSYDASVYKNYWAAYDVPRHLWHFDKSVMRKLLAKFSLQIKQIQPMKLDSFYVSMLSEAYKEEGKKSAAGLLRAVVNGLRSNIKARATGNYSSLIYIIQK
jgi:2-polyprenyl-3-methyl-5-hydroxy-6-metoxy-1,4-benzoquinol methylase